VNDGAWEAGKGGGEIHKKKFSLLLHERWLRNGRGGDSLFVLAGMVPLINIYKVSHLRAGKRVRVGRAGLNRETSKLEKHFLVGKLTVWS